MSCSSPVVTLSCVVGYCLCCWLLLVLLFIACVVGYCLCCWLGSGWSGREGRGWLWSGRLSSEAEGEFSGEWARTDGKEEEDGG